MKPIIPQRLDMIIELDKLERLMPSYACLLNYFSKVIRNKVWSVSNENLLAATLHGCNIAFSQVADVFGENLDIIGMYVDYLDKHSYFYSKQNLFRAFDMVRAKIAIYRTQELAKEHWKQINPYFRKEYAKEDLLSKDLFDILDDLFTNIIDKYPNEFIVPLRNDRFSCLMRGRRKEWHEKADLLPPSIEEAKRLNIINRWNPPDKRFLYLATGTTKQRSSVVETVCEELRLKDGELITTAEFKVDTDALDSYVFDLDYDSISRAEIFGFLDINEKQQVDEIVQEIIDGKVMLTEESVKERINLQDEQAQKIACTFVGKLLLKEMCEAIFVPLDANEDNDNDQKERCYKSFHILAEYLVSKGFVGIAYPSTRMSLLDKSGKNLVLFDVEIAEPILSSFSITSK